MMGEFVEVGAVRKTHGYTGELKLTVYEGFEDDVERADFIFIGKTPERAVPYEVQELRGADWIVRLDGIGDKEAAALIRGQAVYLKAAEIQSPQHVAFQEEMDKFGQLVGFAMHDRTLGNLGTVREVISYPQQVMAAIIHNGTERLVPLNAHFVKGIDFTHRSIVVDLPEGLLDL